MLAQTLPTHEDLSALQELIESIGVSQVAFLLIALGGAIILVGIIMYFVRSIRPLHDTLRSIQLANQDLIRANQVLVESNTTQTREFVQFVRTQSTAQIDALKAMSSVVEHSVEETTEQVTGIREEVSILAKKAEARFIGEMIKIRDEILSRFSGFSSLLESLHTTTLSITSSASILPELKVRLEQYDSRLLELIEISRRDTQELKAIPLDRSKGEDSGEDSGEPQ